MSYLDGTSDVVLARDASALGLTSALRSATSAGRLVRIRRGAYLAAETLAGYDATQSYRATVLAVMANRRQPIAAGMSAAALWGLPIVGAWPTSVYLLSRGNTSRTRRDVVEVARRGDEVLIERDGYLVTSVADTLIQVCRTAGFVAALSMVDAALHIDRYRRTAPMTTLEELREKHAARLPYARSLRVSRLLDMSTSDADTPLETVSRVTIDELGFPEPALQFALHLPRSGRDIFMDFAWPEYRIGGEADGRGKYLGSDTVPAPDPAAKVLHEKQRDNEIRGLRWTAAHWDWNDAWNRSQLRAILVEAGLPITRRTRRYL